VNETSTVHRGVIAGVDHSRNAAHAAAWAAREAADRGLTLHLVHALDLATGAGAVVEPPEYAPAMRSDAESLLDGLAEALRAQYPGLPIETVVSELSAPRTLTALSTDAQLVVTGTRGHGGFAGLLLGSVSLKLAVHAHSPVVVVRADAPDTTAEEIVLGVEPGQGLAPIRFAFAGAARLGARLRVVRAWEAQAAYGTYGTYYVQDTTLTGKEEVEDTVGLIEQVREEFPGVEVTVTATRGNAVPILTEAARGARLLVIGARRRRGPLSVGAGYVVQGLLAHCPTPVAVVPIV
jgi:nucleotide-binding universal stress UspA family protein